MDGFDVDLDDLWKAGRVWDDYADDLHGARGRLAAAGKAVAGLGPRVAPAATAFLTTWAKAAGGHERAAQGNADAIAWARAHYIVMDDQAADDIASRIPWDLAQRLRRQIGSEA